MHKYYLAPRASRASAECEATINDGARSGARAPRWPLEGGAWINHRAAAQAFLAFLLYLGR